MPEDNQTPLLAPIREYPPDLLTIESLDIEAQGIAHRADGKVVFIEGALPFEVRCGRAFFLIEET